MSKQYWLIKSEPETFSIDDLIAAKHQTTPWDGVRNYQARNYLRDKMKVGDLAFFYHSSCAIPAIVGMVEVVQSATPDPSAFDPQSAYYDPKSTPASPRWFMIEVKFQKKFSSPITLQSLKNNPLLESFPLLRKGNRLSVIPVTTRQWQTILAMIN